MSKFYTFNPTNIINNIIDYGFRLKSKIVNSNYYINDEDDFIDVNTNSTINIFLPNLNDIKNKTFIIRNSSNVDININTILNQKLEDNTTVYTLKPNNWVIIIPYISNLEAKWFVIKSGSSDIELPPDLLQQISDLQQQVQDIQTTVQSCCNSGSNGSTSQTINGRYGYVCGGWDGVIYFSSIERFQFPLDSGSTVQVGNLISGSKREFSGNNSSTHGYVCGGYNGQSFLRIIDRFQFPLDNGNAIQIGNMNFIERSDPSANNSSIHGFICGGHNNNKSYSYIERFQFPLDNGIVLYVGNFSSERDNTAANNSTNYGYICGGWRAQISVSFSSIERFQFPLDNGVIVKVGDLPINKDSLSGNNSSIHGYICGGYRYGLNFSSIDRFQFPLDSGNATQVSNLSIARSELSANNSSIYGYVCGGWSSSRFSTIDRFQFPLDNGNAIQVGNLRGNKSGLATNDDTYIQNVLY